MVTLQQVMERLEEDGVLHPAGPYDGRRQVAQVELLGPCTVFRGDTLYLCPEGEHPPERVPEGLDCLLLTRGERGGMTAVLASGDWTARRVYTQVRAVLEEEAIPRQRWDAEQS